MNPAFVLALATVAAVEEPEVRRVPLPAGERLEIDAGGAILDLAIVAEDDGARAIYLLVGPDPGAEGGGSASCGLSPAGERPVTSNPRRLMRVAGNGDPSPTPVGGDLDPSTSHLGAFDLDGDGTDELIVGRRGALEAWTDAGTAGPRFRTTLISGPGMEFLSGQGRPGGPARASRLHVIDVGSVISFGPGDEPGGWGVRGSAELPRAAHQAARALWIRTVPFVAVGASATGGDILASDPESVGEERILVWTVEPEAAGREPLACWARLPEPERRIDADFVVLDGSPALVVTTTRADKLQVFGEKRLRVFRLESDRTRTGVPPILAGETGANLWQSVAPTVTDVDGDGRDDLVLVYWKGVADEKVAFEIWSRGEDGRWPSRPSRETLDVPDGDRSFVSFRDDLDGDGLPDLLVAGKGALRIHPGIRPARRGLPVQRDPSVILALPEGVGPLGSSWFGVGPGGVQGGAAVAPWFAPLPSDLDGDGVAEIVLRASARPERLVLYRWSPREKP